MSIAKIWVVAEVVDGGPTTDLPRAADRRPHAGRHRRGRRLGSTGPSRRRHPRRVRRHHRPRRGRPRRRPARRARWPRPSPPLVEAGNGPDAILFPATYDGRDIAGRLSVKLDRPVLTNVVGLTEADGGLVQPARRSSAAPRSSPPGSPAEGPGIFVIRAKSFAAEPSGGAAGRRGGRRRPRHRGHQRRPHRGPPRRGAHRAQARRGRRGRLGRPRPGREGAVRPDRGAGQAAARGRRRQPGHRRRRLGALLAPGRARPARR